MKVKILSEAEKKVLMKKFTKTDINALKRLHEWLQTEIAKKGKS